MSDRDEFPALFAQDIAFLVSYVTDSFTGLTSSAEDGVCTFTYTGSYCSFPIATVSFVEMWHYVVGSNTSLLYISSDGINLLVDKYLLLVVYLASSCLDLVDSDTI